ncbi:putative ankyrin repeat-containing domain superfamily [Helianthus anomalus]
MKSEDLELRNYNYNTALSLAAAAAAAGNVETAMIMVEKNPRLPEIPGNKGAMPLYMAALFEKPLMVRYLYGISNKMGGDCWSSENRGSVLQKCVEADIFGKQFLHIDVAIKIVNDRPELTSDKWLLSDILVTLAQKTDAFEGTKPYGVLRVIKSCMCSLLIFFASLYFQHIFIHYACHVWVLFAFIPTYIYQDFYK